MTSFTRISEEESPSITIDTDRIISEINPNIYGGFLEHMGRCIYGGIYDPGNPLSDSNGYRLDVLSALRELDIPNIRYPGGNFIATYHWQDGIGPREKRPSRPELAWAGIESNAFGTDEFMHWLSVLGKDVEPYFCLNMGTGTLDEALAWIEYCNGSKGTYWADLRRKNGREEPYGIKYWALGNEVWGSWQVGQLRLDDYIDKAIQWAKAIRFLDPTVKLVLCGQRGHMDWDYNVLTECLPYIDMVAIHIYTNGKSHISNAIAPLAAEKSIEITTQLINLARIKNRVPADIKPTTICFDEWNVWDNFRAPGIKGAEELYTLSDALAIGVWLNVFIRQSKYVEMANLAQNVNVIAPLMTTKDGIVKQTTFWPLMLFSRYMRGWTIGTHVKASAYQGVTQPPWLQSALDEGASYLDVSASINASGWVSLVIVNVHEELDFFVELDLGSVKGQVKTYTVTGRDVTVVNTAEKQEVGITESEWDGKGKFKSGKHSLTLLRYDTGTPPKINKRKEYTGDLQAFIRSGVDGTFGK